MSYEPAGLAATRHRRPTKFTPERIQQIKELIAGGASCEEIAALVGVTVGTLKVNCSRLGISLRRPRVKLLPPAAAKERMETLRAPTAKFTISMKYNGQEQHTALPLTPNMISQLALEASAQDKNISDFAKDLLQAVAEKGLIQKVLEE